MRTPARRSRRANGWPAVHRPRSPTSTMRARSVPRSAADDVAAAKLALAIAELRHSDAEQRAQRPGDRSRISPRSRRLSQTGAARCRGDARRSTAVSARGCGERRRSPRGVRAARRAEAHLGAGGTDPRCGTTAARCVVDAAARSPLRRRRAPPAAPAADVHVVDAHAADARARGSRAMRRGRAVTQHVDVPARHASEAVAGLAIARAYRREPVLADRVGADVVASPRDEAAVTPRSARCSMRSAIRRGRASAGRLRSMRVPNRTSSRGLAEAVARDRRCLDAALIFATAGGGRVGRSGGRVDRGRASPRERRRARRRARRGAQRRRSRRPRASSPRALDLAIAASHELGRERRSIALRVAACRGRSRRAATRRADRRAAAIVASSRAPTAGTIASHVGRLALDTRATSRSGRAARGAAGGRSAPRDASSPSSSSSPGDPDPGARARRGARDQWHAVASAAGAGACRSACTRGSRRRSARDRTRAGRAARRACTRCSARRRRRRSACRVARAMNTVETVCLRGSRVGIGVDVEQLDELDVEPGLFLRLADRGVGDPLALVDEAAGQREARAARSCAR